MKRYLIALCMALVACVSWNATALSPSTQSSQPSQVKSVTISFISVYTVTKTSTREVCLVSGPDGSMVYENPLVTIAQAKGADISQCQQALKQIGGDLKSKYPTTSFNFVINGQQLGLI